MNKFCNHSSCFYLKRTVVNLNAQLYNHVQNTKNKKPAHLKHSNHCVNNSAAGISSPSDHTAMHVNLVIFHWIFSFLTDRSQQVRVGQALSSVLNTNTGAPKGCVLSPALFVLYTADCRSREGVNVLIKFADDASLSCRIQEDDSSYREAVDDFLEWCDRNYLDFNVAKTKFLVIDFRNERNDMEPIVARGQPVEIVENNK